MEKRESGVVGCRWESEICEESFSSFCHSSFSFDLVAIAPYTLITVACPLSITLHSTCSEFALMMSMLI